MTTPPSRSQLKREAVMRGEPMPTQFPATPEPRGKERQITIFNLPVHIDGVEAGWYIESRTKDGDIVWLGRDGLWDHPARCQQFWPTRDEALAFAMENRDGKIADELAELVRLKAASPPLSDDERSERDRAFEELSFLTHYIGGDDDETSQWELIDERWRGLLHRKLSCVAALTAEVERLRAIIPISSREEVCAECGAQAVLKFAEPCDKRFHPNTWYYCPEHYERACNTLRKRTESELTQARAEVAEANRDNAKLQNELEKEKERTRFLNETTRDALKKRREVMEAVKTPDKLFASQLECAAAESTRAAISRAEALESELQKLRAERGQKSTDEIKCRDTGAETPGP